MAQGWGEMKRREASRCLKRAYVPIVKLCACNLSRFQNLHSIPPRTPSITNVQTPSMALRNRRRHIPRLSDITMSYQHKDGPTTIWFASMEMDNYTVYYKYLEVLYVPASIAQLGTT